MAALRGDINFSYLKQFFLVIKLASGPCIEGQTIQWQTENYKRTDNDLQNTTQKEKD
jgi:hypothetical protein